MALVDTYDDQPENSPEFRQLSVCPNPLPSEEGFLVESRRDKVSMGNIAIARTISTPETILDETPLLIFAGFCGSEPGYGKLRDGIAAATGREVVTFQQPRSYTTNPLDHKRLQSKAGWTITKSVLSDTDSDEIDFFGHSWGGHISTGIALHHPDLVRNLLLHDAAGFIDTNVVKLAPGALRLGVNVFRQVLEERPFELTLENIRISLGHLFFNPARTIGEAQTAARSDIKPALRALGQLGITTGILQSEFDELFATKGVSQVAEELTDYYRVISGAGHAAAITHPHVIVDAVQAFYTATTSS